jgi:hypothetical protein
VLVTASATAVASVPTRHNLPFIQFSLHRS